MDPSGSRTNFVAGPSWTPASPAPASVGRPVPAGGSSAAGPRPPARGGPGRTSSPGPAGPRRRPCPPRSGGPCPAAEDPPAGTDRPTEAGTGDAGVQLGPATKFVREPDGSI